MSTTGSQPPSDEGFTGPASGLARFVKRSGRSSAPAQPNSAMQAALEAKAARQIDGEQLIESASSYVGIVGLRVQRIEEALIPPGQRQQHLPHVHRGAHRSFDAALAGAG